MVNSAYPVSNEDVLYLIVHIIEYKNQKDSIIERKSYENMGVIQFVNRLIKSRPITFFYSPDDKYHLYDYTITKGGFDQIEKKKRNSL